MEGVLVCLSLFGMIAAIVIVPQVLRSRERARLHDTLRAAYERGQPVPPELVEALSQPRRPALPADRASRDLRTGIVWLFVGLGFLAIGGALYAERYYKGGSVEALSLFASIAAIPIFIGLAFLLLAMLGRGKSH